MRFGLTLNLPTAVSSADIAEYTSYAGLPRLGADDRRPIFVRAGVQREHTEDLDQRRAVDYSPTINRRLRLAIGAFFFEPPL